LKTVWKLTIDPARSHGPQQVPPGYEVLSVHRDPEDPHLVAVYISNPGEPEGPAETVEIYATSTGRPVFGQDEYLGTAICPPYAWHVWRNNK